MGSSQSASIINFKIVKICKKKKKKKEVKRKKKGREKKREIDEYLSLNLELSHWNKYVFKLHVFQLLY